MPKMGSIIISSIIKASGESLSGEREKEREREKMRGRENERERE